MMESITKGRFMCYTYFPISDPDHYAVFPPREGNSNDGIYTKGRFMCSILIFRSRPLHYYRNDGNYNWVNKFPETFFYKKKLFGLNTQLTFPIDG